MAATTISSYRQVDPQKLSRQLRGELDWIVSKALEKDRDRPYASANSMARDIQRYLNDEPVEACPPSRLYQVQKFARRNKVALVTTALVATSLLVLSGVTVWKSIEATRERDRVARIGELAERERSNTELARAESEELAALGVGGIGRQAIAGGLREALQQEIAELRKLTVEASKSLLAAISESQRKRLDPLILQIDGPLAFRRLDVQERLDLNLTQKASINRLTREYQSLFIGKRSEDKAKLLEEASRKRKQLMKDFLLLLTAEQLKQWEEMVGPKADQSPASETTW